METTVWQEYNQDIILVGISNTSNLGIINNLVEENSLTFPILYDPGSAGGVEGGDTYEDYYMPNDGSPYPRDFIIDQYGILQYANNEIDTEWMLFVLDELTGNNCFDWISGDINHDNIINILDIVTIVNIILGTYTPDECQQITSDINGDNNVTFWMPLLNVDKEKGAIKLCEKSHLHDLVHTHKILPTSNPIPLDIINKFNIL